CGRTEPAAGMGPGDFSQVDVASGVDANAVRRDELARDLAFWLVAQACQNVAFSIVEADAWANAVSLGIGRDSYTELAHIGDIACLVNIQATGPCHVDPLRFKLTVGVKHLDAVILPVGDVDPAS